MANGRPPSIDDRLNYIWRQLVDPCDAPLTLWIEALWPALFEFLLAWFMLDLKQIFISAVRPSKAMAGFRTRKHMSFGQKGKRGKLKGYFGKLISFDLNEWIGKRLDYEALLTGREVKPGVAFLWIVEGLIERFFFYYMLLDLGSQFFYRWLSAVAESRYCQARDDAVILATSESLVTVGMNEWFGSILPIVEKGRNYDFYNSNGYSQSVAPGIATFSAKAVRIAGAGPATVGIRLRIVTGPRAGQTNENVKLLQEGEEASVGCQIDILPGEGVVMEDKSDGAFFDLQSPKFYSHAGTYFLK